MMNKTVFVLLLLVVAAAEGRARGSKLGNRKSRQSIWGRPRQDPNKPPAYPQPQVSGYNPQPQAGSYPQAQGSSPPAAPLTPTPVSQGGYPPQGGQQTGTYQPAPTQGGYQQGPAQSSQVPTVVSGIAPIAPSICKYPGFFPTPGSCVNFYRCVDWTGTGTYYSVFQFNCPAGTIFDDELDICNHIAWAVPKRPECTDMLQGSLVPLGSGPPPPGPASGSPAATYPPLVTPAPPIYPPQPPIGVGPPQTGTGYPPQPVAPPVAPPVTGPTPPDSGDAPPRPFALQCYADEVYRRHPIYCNRYYKCAWDGQDWVFPMLTCPEGLIFNDAGQQCADPVSIAPCDGQLAPATAPEATVTDMPTESPVTDPPTGQQGPAVSPDSLYDCPATGYYPFEGDCIRFYKCVELDSGALKGLLYKCPDQFGYSEEKKRCDKSERLPECTKSSVPAHIRVDSATPLYPEDLLWFFNN